MPTPEQEQIAALVTSQVAEAVKKVLIEERSLLISSLINEVNSHLSATLKSYFEEQLAIQKQEFQSELQTKIDELKFQHYQQLERLGQAVEEVMSSQPLDEFSEEILDDIYDEVAETELDQFHEFESEFFADDDLDLEMMDSETSAIAQDSSLDPNIDQDEELDQLESELFAEDDFDVVSPESGLEIIESEISEITLEENINEPLILQESIIDLNLAPFNDQVVDRNAEFDQVKSELIEENESNQSELEELNTDDELNLFAENSVLDYSNDLSLVTDLMGDNFESITNENSEDQEQLFLDPFADLDIGSEELDESPEIIYAGEEYEFGLDDLSLEPDSNQSDQVENSSLLGHEDLTQFHQLFGDDESDLDFAASFELETSEISLDNALESDHELRSEDLIQQRLILNSEFEQLAQNVEQETEDLQLDEELNFFAETMALDELNDDMGIVSKPNLEDELWQNSDPFADLSHEEIINIEATNVDRTLEEPEIIYEGEEDEYNTDLELSLELEQELDLIAELSEGNRLNLELEQELNLVFTESLAEIGDGDLSEFADLETENDFWNSAPEIDSPSTSKGSWHLGIDFGYSEIRACLFNQTTTEIYPLVFDGAEQIGADVDLFYINDQAISFQGIKQFLRLGIPYQIQDQWQPKLKWINNQTLSLKDFQVAAQQLFNQIKNFGANNDLIDISNIIENLETVIIGHPHSWSDAYIFNLREAVLESGLVNNIEQVLVIDQAIASTFSLTSLSVKAEESPSKASPQLFLDSGAFTTTLGFTSGSERRLSDLEYAGLGINQDIVLQLLFPKTKDKFSATKFIRSGEPNPVHRTDLQQHLLNSAIGIESLAIAEQIKLFFSEQPNIQIWQGNVGGKPLKISRSELEIKVIQPFIQSLNDAIDQLIIGTDPEDISQIAIAGGTTQLPSIHQWLEAKFANAQVTILPSSNLAQGLAITPLFSQYLDVNRHQYSDFFLLSEICALNLQESVNLSDLIKKIQNRGVNAKACGDRLAKILSGQLPAGILPWQEPEKFLVLADSNLHPHLLACSLFTPLGNDLYDPNPTSTQLLGAYLKMLESSINQSFSEPLVFPSFAAERIPEVIA